LRSNTLRACRTLLRAKPISTSDGVLELLGALKTPQFPTVGATQATVIGLLLKLLQARLVALRVRHRVLRRLLGAFEAAQFPAVGATERTVIGLQLLQTCLVTLCGLRRALRCLLGALELAELTPLDAT
jgi:hypothetical protein